MTKFFSLSHHPGPRTHSRPPRDPYSRSFEKWRKCRKSETKLLIRKTKHPIDVCKQDSKTAESCNNSLRWRRAVWSPNAFLQEDDSEFTMFGMFGRSMRICSRKLNFAYPSVFFFVKCVKTRLSTPLRSTVARTGLESSSRVSASQSVRCGECVIRRALTLHSFVMYDVTHGGVPLHLEYLIFRFWQQQWRTVTEQLDIFSVQ